MRGDGPLGIVCAFCDGGAGGGLLCERKKTTQHAAKKIRLPKDLDTES